MIEKKHLSAYPFFKTKCNQDEIQISHSHADDGKKQHSPYTLQQVDKEKKYSRNTVHHYRV